MMVDGVKGVACMRFDYLHVLNRICKQQRRRTHTLYFLEIVMCMKIREQDFDIASPRLTLQVDRTMKDFVLNVRKHLASWAVPGYCSLANEQASMILHLSVRQVVKLNISSFWMSRPGWRNVVYAEA